MNTGAQLFRTVFFQCLEKYGRRLSNAWKALMVVMALGGMTGEVIAVTVHVSPTGNHTPPFADWASAATNLREAVAVTVEGDLVWVAEGTYLLDGAVVVSNAVRVESVDGWQVTTVDGNYPAFTNRCFTLAHTGACLVGFTIVNGFAQGVSAEEYQGGGVRALLDGGTISNCVVIGNRAREGGGLYNGHVFNCRIMNNQASSSGGGISGGSGMLVRDSIIAENRASSGGGVNGPVTIEWCFIVDNVATQLAGGGVSGANAIRNCLIQGNSAAAMGGGVNAGTVYDSRIISNRSANLGGGGYQTTFWHCDVIGNAATNSGGGMYHTAAYNCLIAGNSAYQGGGAFDYDYIRQLHNCTVVDNSARDWGGGLYHVYARNTIVQFNHAAQYTNHYDSAFLFSCVAPLPAGDGNIADDPLFADPASGNYHLTSASPCVDAGTNLTSAGFSRDRDGVSRPLDGLNDGTPAWDMGAYEYAHPLVDTDGDHMRDVEEITSGTDATNDASFLAMEMGEWTPDGIQVRWRTSPNLVYQLDRAMDLTAETAFVGLMTNIAGRVDAVAVTDTTAVASGPYVYRVRTETNPPLPGMVYIPPGLFRMGNSMNEKEGFSDERPVHYVDVGGFYIAEYEVTQTEWDAVHAWGIARGYQFDSVGQAKGTNHPVVMIYWYDAVKWCNARSQMDGLSPCYTVSGQVYTNGQHSPDCDWSANGYRLLTEAEWEKAARGGWEGQRFPWWDLYGTISHEQANYQCVQSAGTNSLPYDVSTTPGYHPSYSNAPTPYTSPVGSFAPNDYGVHDAAGNVLEYCWDWYDRYWYEKPEASLPDCRGPTNGMSRVARGGIWTDSAYCSRCAFRSSSGMDWRSFYTGFRVARSRL